MHRLFARTTLLTGWLLLAALPACSTPGGAAAATEPVPEWLQKQITISARSKYPNWISVQAWEHEGQTYYTLQAGCCDRFNELYDAKGQYLCAPSGGFTGQGDGKCTDWRAALKAGESNARRIWPREAGTAQ